MIGKVKWFSDKKGYGFLVGEDSKEYFTHYSNIDEEGHKTLLEGQNVEFTPTENPKGLTAIKIKKT